MERPEFYEALGRTVQVLRTDRGIDRKDLAEAVGISYSYLAGIENGKKRPSSKVLLQIARALDLRSHELMEAAEVRIDRTAAATAAPPPAAMAAPSQRRAWFHRMEAAPAESPRFHDEPSSERLRIRSADLFVNRISQLADDLNDDDHELLLETARRLAQRHRPEVDSQSGSGVSPETG
jgi:transcriptional regulator with XRE-family HTH domain